MVSIAETAAQTGKELLGIPADADTSTVRQAVLRQLREGDYMLTQSRLVGAGLLLGAPLPVRGARADAGAGGIWGSRLSEEVEAYCGRFWSLPIPERRRQWDELAGYCGQHPKLRGRLAVLQPLVEFELPDLSAESPALRALVRLLCDLSVLLPPRRARHRHLRLSRMRFDDDGTELPPSSSRLDRSYSQALLADAAQHLSETHPRLAQLDGGGCVRALSEEVAARWSKQRALRPFVKRAATVNTPSLSKTAEAASSSGGYSWLAYLALSVIVGLIRIATSHSSSDARFQERLNSATQRAVNTRAIEDMIRQSQAAKSSRGQRTEVQRFDSAPVPRSAPSRELEEMIGQQAEADAKRLQEMERAVEATRILEGRPVDAAERRRIAEELLRLRGIELPQSLDPPGERE